MNESGKKTGRLDIIKECFINTQKHHNYFDGETMLL